MMTGPRLAVRFEVVGPKCGLRESNPIVGFGKANNALVRFAFIAMTAVGLVPELILACCRVTDNARPADRHFPRFVLTNDRVG